MSLVHVVIVKSYKDYRKGNVEEITEAWASNLLKHGYAQKISKETYDFMCLEKWKREVKMKHGADKVFMCDAWFNFFKNKGAIK